LAPSWSSLPANSLAALAAGASRSAKSRSSGQLLQLPSGRSWRRGAFTVGVTLLGRESPCTVRSAGADLRKQNSSQHQTWVQGRLRSPHPSGRRRQRAGWLLRGWARWYTGHMAGEGPVAARRPARGHPTTPCSGQSTRLRRGERAYRHGCASPAADGERWADQTK
jgi:hypothetical protein